MILKKRFYFDQFYTVFVENSRDEFVVLTYGNLRKNKGQDYVTKFIESFKEYMSGRNTDNDSLVALDVPEDELDKVKEAISKFKI